MDRSGRSGYLGRKGKGLQIRSCSMVWRKREKKGGAGDEVVRFGRGWLRRPGGTGVVWVGCGCVWRWLMVFTLALGKGDI